MAADDFEAYPSAAIAIAEGDRTAARPYLTKAIDILDREPRHSGCLAALRSRLLALLE